MTGNPQDEPTGGGPQEHYSQPPPPPPPPPGQAPGFGQQAQGYGQQAQAPVSPSDARMWAMFAHLGGILLFVIAPLVIYLIYKDRDPFIRRHSTQALNFQLVIGIIELVSIPLMVIGIGILTATVAWIAFLVFTILAAIAANKGQEYTYPYVPQMVT